MNAHAYPIVFLAFFLPGGSAWVPVQIPDVGKTQSVFRQTDTQATAEAGLNDQQVFAPQVLPLQPVQPLPLQPLRPLPLQTLQPLPLRPLQPQIAKAAPAQAPMPVQARAGATSVAATKPETYTDPVTKKSNGSFFGPGMVYGGASLVCLLIVSGGVVVARKKARQSSDLQRIIMSGTAQASQDLEENLGPEASRRDFMLKAAAGVAALSTATPAFADVDYDGIKYLGGGDKIDLNNANIRAYIKLSGMYPGAAGKIASWKGDPFKSVGDVYKIAGLTEPEKAVIKKYESRFIVLEPKPEYVIDRMNNGLYR